MSNQAALAVGDSIGLYEAKDPSLTVAGVLNITGVCLLPPSQQAVVYYADSSQGTIAQLRVFRRHDPSYVLRRLHYPLSMLKYGPAMANFARQAGAVVPLDRLYELVTDNAPQEGPTPSAPSPATT